MRLNTELNKILNNPDTREKLSSQGVDTETSTPEHLGRVMAEDVVALRKLIKATGLKLN
jgi:tripartite-type tricarboxylate transporter receptor subunit TctC